MSIYSKLDQGIIIPIAEKLKGRNLTGELKSLITTQWLSEKDLFKLQSIKLQKLVRHCYENVPYYTALFNHLGLKPDDIQSRYDLPKIPVLTKQIIKEHFNDLISKDISSRNSFEGSTGGSTGMPMRFMEDINSWNCLRALSFRGWTWAGFDVGEKMFTLAGNSLVKKNTKSGLFFEKNLYDRVILRNQKHNCTDITSDALMEYYQAMIKYRPVAIRGYASSLYFFAKFIEDNDLPICSIRVVFTTGEKLHPKYRNKIQQVFRAPVFDGYGASDGGVSAHECYMHEGLHIGEEHCIVEIINDVGAILPNGEIGHVVSTDLNNYVFPFLRYRVGDLAYIKEELCSCGRSHRLLGEVIGREGRAIYNKQGRPFSSIVLDNMMFKDMDIHTEECQRLYERINQFQIRQDKNGDLTILIKPTNPSESTKTFSYIVDNFHTFFPDSKVELLFVDSIPTLPSGKEDYCVSEFDFSSLTD